MTEPTRYVLTHPLADQTISTTDYDRAAATYREFHITDPFSRPEVYVNGEYNHEASVAFDKEVMG